MSIWKKTMLYLGLGADEEYDEAYPAVVTPDPRVAPPDAAPAGAPAPVAAAQPHPQPHPAPAVAPQHGAMVPQPATEAGERQVRPAAPPSQGRSSVRPLPATTSSRPYTVSPTSFNDGQEVADRFKTNQPVIVNLQDADRDLARRIIDFASGLCYGVGGHMEKVANQVYLLTPIDVEVSDEERRQLRDRGLHDA